jgi:hypothetical protein
VLILLFADKVGDLRVVLTIRSAGLKNCMTTALLRQPRLHPRISSNPSHSQMPAKQPSQAAKPTPCKKPPGKPRAAKPLKKSASP